MGVCVCVGVGVGVWGLGLGLGGGGRGGAEAGEGDRAKVCLPGSAAPGQTARRSQRPSFTRLFGESEEDAGRKGMAQLRELAQGWVGCGHGSSPQQDAVGHEFDGGVVAHALVVAHLAG